MGSAEEKHVSSSVLSVALPLMAQGPLDFLFLPSLFPVVSFTDLAYRRVSAVGRSQRGKWQTPFFVCFWLFKIPFPCDCPDSGNAVEAISSLSPSKLIPVSKQAHQSGFVAPERT